MSTNIEITPFTIDNCHKNNLAVSETICDDSIENFALRKSLLRNIPNCYVEVTNKKSLKKDSHSRVEEYNKIIEEIIIMKETIEVLQQSKQKKLRKIEELRCIMRQAGNKQFNNNINIINNKGIKDQYGSINHYEREKHCKNNFNSNSIHTKGIMQIDFTDGIEGGSLSLGPSTSDLSSGKDEEAIDEKDLPPSNQDIYRCFRKESNMQSSISIPSPLQ